MNSSRSPSSPRATHFATPSIFGGLFDGGICCGGSKVDGCDVTGVAKVGIAFMLLLAIVAACGVVPNKGLGGNVFAKVGIEVVGVWAVGTDAVCAGLLGNKDICGMGACVAVASWPIDWIASGAAGPGCEPNVIGAAGANEGVVVLDVPPGWVEDEDGCEGEENRG